MSIDKLKEIIDNTDNIVFFGGAGVSTESGIQDYRSVDGLYKTKYKYPVETILSNEFFYDNTEEFYKFYKDKMLALDAKPNFAHTALATLEKNGRLKAIVTQNIDGLHQAAGSTNVLELHGSAKRNYCIRCHKFYDALYIKQSITIPLCSCGGIIKPDVVLYGENLSSEIIKKTIKHISDADVLIIGGTSLAVYPAASFIDYFNSDKIILINKGETAKNANAKLTFNDSIGKILNTIVNNYK